MKKVFFIILILNSLALITYSQGWFQQTSGVTGILRSVFFINENTGLAVGNSKLRTTNGGLNWTQLFIPYDSYDIQFLDTSFGFLLGFFKPVTLQKSTNGGVSWTLVTYPVVQGYPYLSMKFFNSNTGFINTSKTTNGGLNWTDTYPTQTMRNTFFLNENTGWCCSLYGTVIRTTNSGVNWAVINAAPGTTLNSIFFINENTGWSVSATSIIYKSTNGGLNWASVYNQGFCGLNTIYFVNDLTGWVAGCNGAINKTVDGGMNWTLQAFGGNSINDMQFLNAYTGWAVGENGIILKTTTGGITFISPISSEIPKQFSLSQNYPNPFNPSTKIKFSIPLLRGVSAGRGVLLKIYNILGHEVSSLVNEQLKPGTYEVQWDAADYSSGVYYYKLTSWDPSPQHSGSGNNYSETKKMVLLK